MFDPSTALSWIPDEPACVEARGMLLEGRGTIVWAGDGGVMVYAAQDRLASIVGRVTWAEIAPAMNGLRGDLEVVIREEDARRAGAPPVGWEMHPVTVLAEGAELPPHLFPYAVREFTMRDADMLQHVPDELREELQQALLVSTMVAAFEQELPVAFCYVGWQTERWWDVSIDTLEAWRRRGYATAAAHALITMMRAAGKRAVWAALDSNIASLRVAENLGFERVAKLFVLTR